MKIVKILLNVLCMVYTGPRALVVKSVALYAARKLKKKEAKA